MTAHPTQLHQPTFLNHRITRKLLTRSLWWWETHRSHPIREKVFALPSVRVNPYSERALAILCTPDTALDAAWSAQSLLRFLPDDIGLYIVVDGDVSTRYLQSIKILFPGVKLAHTRQFTEALQSIAPNIVKLAGYHPLGRKLTTILALQQSYNVLYCDADILCFGKIPELVEAFLQPTQSFYIQDINGVNTDPVLLHRINELGLSYAQNLNTGLIYIPQGHLHIKTAELILAGVEETLKSWFGETTILATLLQEAKAQPLPKSRYVVSTDRQFYFEPDVDYDQIAVRHFVTPVRHLMYSKGLPHLWKSLSVNIA